MRRLWTLVGLLALAFGLRVAGLDAVPLRGDEAFAVRYWAANPSDSVRTLINDNQEPHPIGTFVAFWAWKTIAGDSEFAMRYLPLLGNMLGAAALAAIARRLFASRTALFLAVTLWAINPFQIWHAQDVRNYALWAGLSPLAMWLFLRAISPPRINSRRAWTFYLIAQTLALYAFFLEVFFLVVQALYVLLFHRTTTSLKRVVFVWVILAILLVPWAWQLLQVSQSDYPGNTEDAAPVLILTSFVPTLLVGPEATTWHWLATLTWLALLSVSVIRLTRQPHENRLLVWLLLWFAVPVALLLIAATRSSIFHPRYIIAAAPPLLLLLAFALKAPRLTGSNLQRIAALASIALLVTPAISFGTLREYYSHTDPKSPDWPALATYLENRIPIEGNHIILHTMADPAFMYYYHGQASEQSLFTDVPIPAQLTPELGFRDSIWLVGRNPAAESFLHDNMQNTSYDQISDFPVMQFWHWTPSPAEWATSADITFDTTVRLRGYTIQGPDSATSAITVLLFWEPLAQSSVDYKVFVHLLGPSNPATGGPLWDQDDHRPQFGFASTQSWQLGVLLRDPYRLLDDTLPELAPGQYSIVVGLYDPATNERLSVMASDGTPLGDSAELGSFVWPLRH